MDCANPPRVAKVCKRDNPFLLSGQKKQLGDNTSQEVYSRT